MPAVHTLPIREPFWRWLSRFPPDPIVDQDNGADRVAIIMDDRDDDVVRRVYANAITVLGPTWNHRFLRQHGGGWAEYNRLFFSSEFWGGIPEAFVLIYQRDTVLFRRVPDAAFQWDMIGAPCGAIGTQHWTMNGGLSLRRRAAMLDMLQIEDTTSEPEDRFFTRVLRHWGGRIPDLQTAAQFAAESGPCIMGRPVGVHGTDKHYMSDEQGWQLVNDALAEIA